MKYTCPNCGKSTEWTIEQLTANNCKVTCPQCNAALEIVGDYAYMPFDDGSLNLADDEPEPEPQPALDPLYNHAIDYIVTCNAITPVMLARYFDIPMERAMVLIQQLEDNHIIGPANGGAPRTILIPHNTNLPFGLQRHYDPDAPTTPPPFNRNGNIQNGNDGGKQADNGDGWQGDNGDGNWQGRGSHRVNPFDRSGNPFLGNFPGNIKTKSCSINCSGCLIIVLFLVLLATLFLK